MEEKGYMEMEDEDGVGQVRWGDMACRVDGLCSKSAEDLKELRSYERSNTHRHHGGRVAAKRRWAI